MPSYDAIIVGAGIAGAIMALELAKQKKYVLILEAGPSDKDSRQSFQNRFLASAIKLPECPYPPYYDGPQDDSKTPDQLHAPRYNSLMQFNWPPYRDRGTPSWLDGITTFNKYSHVLVCPNSEIPLLSTYERMVGGTTWHWLGTSLRLLPSDIQTRTNYQYGTDWPIPYVELSDDYCLAEKLIGVSACASEQDYFDIKFPPGYSYPMPPIASTYSDNQLGAMMQGLSIDFDGEKLVPAMNNTPQGRNSVYTEDGRPACRGNNSCIPICPIQAKFDATMVLSKAMQLSDANKRPYVTLLPQTVAYNLNLDATKQRVTSVDAKNYDKEQNGTVLEQNFTAPVIVIAAHAIETARLLLYSSRDVLPAGVGNSSGRVGCNLMDHVVYLSWGLSPQPLYPFRGPRSSSGIESLRDGNFRAKHAAFRVDVGNEGWGWADGDPATIIGDFVNGTNNSLTNPEINHQRKKNQFGSDLVGILNDKLTRMMRFCFLVEQQPDPCNRVSLSATAVDGLGIPRPVVNYKVGDYSRDGIRKAIDTTAAIFNYAKIENFTQTHLDDPGYPTIDIATPDNPQSTPCNVYGAGHIMGTYCMGTNPATSVVNADQQSHDHANLFLLGSGTFPTTGTANPTLTVAALAFRASRAVLKQLGTRS